MAKQNRFGQAAILTSIDYQKIFNASDNSKCELVLNILRYTGERAGAVLKLDVMNIYDNPYKSIPRDTIIFPAATRKRSPDGKAKTREVPISRNLKAELQKFTPPKYGFLFPSPTNPDQPITLRAFNDWLRRTCIRAGLSRRGISSHSPRRTFITELSEKGVPIRIIQSLTGHSSLNTLQRYIEVSEESKRGAIELL
ncbi:MAG: site-specific integrase [Lyngbya sp.]|nr:site-specific integrase [Lyngbya sp.]